MARHNAHKVPSAQEPETLPAEEPPPSGIGWWWIPLLVWAGALVLLFGTDFIGLLVKLFSGPAT